MQYTQPSSGAFGVAHSVLVNKESFTKKDLLLQVKTKLKRSTDVESLINNKIKQLKGVTETNLFSNLLPKFECIQENDDKEEEE